MPVNEASEFLALTLIFVVHVVGGLMLVWGMLDGESRPRWYPRWWRRDDGPDGDPPSPRPSPPPGRAALPLPGAVGSDVRLRDDERRLRDSRPRPPRRPRRDPRPERVPQRR